MEVISTFLKYKSVKISRFFPIGNEPNGKQWTGFQSIENAKEGYVLVFSEDNAAVKSAVKTWFSAGQHVSFTPVAGSGKALER